MQLIKQSAAIKLRFIRGRRVTPESCSNGASRNAEKVAPSGRVKPSSPPSPRLSINKLEGIFEKKEGIL